MMNKELINLIMVFILFLFLLSIIIFVPKLIEVSQSKKLIKNAIDSKDSSFCNKISLIKYQQQCFLELAIYTKNPSYCEKSGDSEKCISLISRN
ncbi:MAG: hypothetical protein Q7S27_06950 [Nanoarchaeota archaeon]|nr:hypothetical protein [Nanoarchaeota archaeon]